MAPIIIIILSTIIMVIITSTTTVTVLPRPLVTSTMVEEVHTALLHTRTSSTIPCTAVATIPTFIIAEEEEIVTEIESGTTITIGEDAVVLCHLHRLTVLPWIDIARVLVPIEEAEEEIVDIEMI